MNRIRINRMLLSGLVTLIVFIGVELIIEGLMFNTLFIEELEAWNQKIDVLDWDSSNNVLNIFIALVNSTILVWLYAALRPMFGVGTRTALIASTFALLIYLASYVNQVNLGTIPLSIATIEAGYLVIEMPIAIIAGALVYEAELVKA